VGHVSRVSVELLNRGFPLRSALTIARERSIVGSQYLVVGDGNADIAQARGHVPWVAEVESVGADAYRLRIISYPTQWGGMRTHFRPAVEDCSSVFLIPDSLPEMTLSTAELREYLTTDFFPVFLEGELTWSEPAAESL